MALHIQTVGSVYMFFEELLLNDLWFLLNCIDPKDFWTFFYIWQDVSPRAIMASLCVVGHALSLIFLEHTTCFAYYPLLYLIFLEHTRINNGSSHHIRTIKR